MKTGAFTLYRKILYMSNLFLSSKLDAWRSLLEAYSFHQAAILAKERRQTWSNIVATLRIVANVQGNARGRYGRLVGQYVISRSYRLKSFWFSFPPHKRIKDKTNKLLSVTCAGRGHEACFHDI
jgi:hypothetical protein